MSAFPNVHPVHLALVDGILGRLGIIPGEDLPTFVPPAPGERYDSPPAPHGASITSLGLPNLIPADVARAFLLQALPSLITAIEDQVTPAINSALLMFRGEITPSILSEADLANQIDRLEHFLEVLKIGKAG